MRHFGFAKLKERRFFQLSALIIVFLMLSPFLRENWLFQILVQLFMLNSMLVTLSAAGNRRRIRQTLWILWLVAAIASLAHQLPDTAPLRAMITHLEIGCRTLLLLGCFVCILSFVFRNLRATLDDIFAALAAYLLLAYVFAMIFTMVRLWDPGSFRIPDPTAGSPTPAIRDEMTYFSFVTIATLGYGDIVPLTPFARMLTVIEAVAGQFYVAVVVALLVGSLVARPQAPGDTDG